MGLLDVIHGMQNGPRGPSEPATTSGGMSKMAMALIALLGYKALKSFTCTQPTPTPGGNPGVNPTEASSASASSGGIMGGLGELRAKPPHFARRFDQGSRHGPDQYPDESIWVISRRTAGGSK